MVLAAMLAGCRGNTEAHQHGPASEHSATPGAGPADGPDPLARTEFNDRLENYFEFQPLVPGKPSQFLIHLTDLKTGKPVQKADVTLTVRSPNGAQTKIATAKVGKVTGIYVANLAIDSPGTYGIAFRVRNEVMDETLELKGFEVAEKHAAEAEEESRGPTVTFLMEQQWLVDMKLAAAVEKEFAKPVASTGRIIPATNSRAIVSSPLPGKVTGGYIPRIGQQVYNERSVAMAPEIPKAAEEAQVREATVIPKDAVLDREGKKFVYVLLSGEKFERRAVTVADGLGNFVGITSGLSTGDRVVSQGAYHLFQQETNPAEPKTPKD